VDIKDIKNHGIISVVA